jgi:hypothetical protein
MKLTDQQLADRIKQLAVFCMEHQGKCFNGFSAAKVFRYVAFHLLTENLFVQTNKNGKVQMVVFAWKANASDILHRDASMLPQFNWIKPQDSGDAILIAQVIGNRRWMPQIFSQVMAHWPDSPRLRLFAYRWRENAPKLTELTWTAITRFTYGHAFNP